MTRPVHFEILADDPKKIAAFYEAALGWSISVWEGGEEGYLLATTGPDDVPGINGGIMARTFPQAVINTAEVESLDDMLAKVEAAGGKMVHGPTDIPGVGRHAYCSDPEGNLFGLLQPQCEVTPHKQ
jgi:predicted enzyme related to lactoylglutathione lyase